MELRNKKKVRSLSMTSEPPYLTPSVEQHSSKVNQPLFDYSSNSSIHEDPLLVNSKQVKDRSFKVTPLSKDERALSYFTKLKRKLKVRGASSLALAEAIEESLLTNYPIFARSFSLKVWELNIPLETALSSIIQAIDGSNAAALRKWKTLYTNMSLASYKNADEAYEQFQLITATLASLGDSKTEATLKEDFYKLVGLDFDLIPLFFPGNEAPDPADVLAVLPAINRYRKTEDAAINAKLVLKKVLEANPQETENLVERPRRPAECFYCASVSHTIYKCPSLESYLKANRKLDPEWLNAQRPFCKTTLTRFVSAWIKAHPTDSTTLSVSRQVVALPTPPVLEPLPTSLPAALPFPPVPPAPSQGSPMAVPPVSIATAPPSILKDVRWAGKLVAPDHPHKKIVAPPVEPYLALDGLQGETPIRIHVDTCAPYSVVHPSLLPDRLEGIAASDRRTLGGLGAGSTPILGTFILYFEIDGKNFVERCYVADAEVDLLLSLPWCQANDISISFISSPRATISTPDGWSTRSVPLAFIDALTWKKISARNIEEAPEKLSYSKQALSPQERKFLNKGRSVKPLSDQDLAKLRSYKDWNFQHPTPLEASSDDDAEPSDSPIPRPKRFVDTDAEWIRAHQPLLERLGGKADDVIPEAPKKLSAGDIAYPDDKDTERVLRTAPHVFEESFGSGVPPVDFETTDDRTIKGNQWPLSAEELKVLFAQTLDDLKCRRIERSMSPHNSPILVVQRFPDKHYWKVGERNKRRTAYDGRLINAIIVKRSYPIPLVMSLLRALGGYGYYIRIDLSAGFLQIILDPACRHWLAFTVPGVGKFQWRRLALGMVNSPSEFQRIMEEVLGHISGVHIYIDDIFIAGSTKAQVLRRLKRVLVALSLFDLKLALPKVIGPSPSIPVLGFEVSRSGIVPDQARIQSLVEAGNPSTRSQLHSFLNAIAFYREHIPCFADLLAPLRHLLKKGSRIPITSPSYQLALHRLRTAVAQHTINQFPDPALQKKVQSDASKYGLGAVVFQETKGKWVPLCFKSKLLTPLQQTYAPIEREILAIHYAVTKHREWLVTTEFIIETDHEPLVPILNGIRKEIPKRVLKYAVDLYDYSYKVLYKPGKLLFLADYLSRLPNADSELTIKKISASVDKAQDDLDPALKGLLIHKAHLRTQHGTPEEIKYDLRRAWDLNWTSMNQDAEDALDECFCSLVIRRTPVQHLLPGYRDRGLYPGHVIHLDLFTITKGADKSGDIFDIQLLGERAEMLDEDTIANGYFALIAVDSFSGYRFGRILPSKAQANVVGGIKAIVQEASMLPSMTIMDRGNEFNESQLFLEKHGVDVHRTSAYNPGANGLAESTVKYLKKLLVLEYDFEEKSLFAAFDAALMASRQKFSKTRGDTPFFLWFGRDPGGKYLSGLPEAVRERFAIIQKNRILEAETRKLPPIKLSPGDVVVTKVSERGKKALQAAFDATPHRVVSVGELGRVTLRNMVTGNETQQNLKRCRRLKRRYSDDWCLNDAVLERILEHFTIAADSFRNDFVVTFCSAANLKTNKRLEQAKINSWSNLIIYLNPPFRLFEGVIAKLLIEKPRMALIILPEWHEDRWYLWLKQLDQVVAQSVALPCEDDLFLLRGNIVGKPNWEARATLVVLPEDTRETTDYVKFVADRLSKFNKERSAVIQAEIHAAYSSFSGGIKPGQQANVGGSVDSSTSSK